MSTALGGGRERERIKPQIIIHIILNLLSYRTDIGKCTHQCDETQGNNSTRYERFRTKIVFFGYKKIDNKTFFLFLKKFSLKKKEKRKKKIFFFFKALLSFLLLLSSIYLLAPEEDNFCRKRSCRLTIVSLCFVALVSTFH